MRIEADTSLRAYSIMPTMLHIPSQHNKETCDPVINELCKPMLFANFMLGRWCVLPRNDLHPSSSDGVLLAGAQTASHAERAELCVYV